MNVAAQNVGWLMSIRNELERRWLAWDANPGSRDTASPLVDAEIAAAEELGYENSILIRRMMQYLRSEENLSVEEAVEVLFSNSP
jgi:hypothetical protein